MTTRFGNGQRLEYTRQGKHACGGEAQHHGSLGGRSLDPPATAETLLPCQVGCDTRCRLVSRVRALTLLVGSESGGTTWGDFGCSLNALTLCSLIFLQLLFTPERWKCESYQDLPEGSQQLPCNSQSPLAQATRTKIPWSGPFTNSRHNYCPLSGGQEPETSAPVVSRVWWGSSTRCPRAEVVRELSRVWFAAVVQSLSCLWLFATPWTAARLGFLVLHNINIL